MERFAREQAPERAERTDTLVWGKNAVTELLKSGGAVDTVYLTDTMPQAVAGYYTALAKECGAVVKRVPGNKLQKMCGTPDHQGVAARAAEVEYAALDDLFRAAEARGEPYTGQVAVGAVILNRIEHPSFPDTLAGVIYQPGAFSCLNDGQFNEPVADSAKRAAQDAINGWDPSGGAIYYFNPKTATNKWIWSRPAITTIGNHRFCS